MDHVALRIGIVDADLLGREKHRFPNLVCEKISGYWKEKGAEVRLILDASYNWISYINLLEDDTQEDIAAYDIVYVSKVFTDTPIPQVLQGLTETNGMAYFGSTEVHIGGTGFYFDKAPNLPDEIEHHMPDYHLYDQWIESEVKRAEEDAEKEKRKFNYASFMVQFKEYTDYSIGFLTRGCFRKCQFCVNQKYDHVFLHSNLTEFYDHSRNKICLLDDNFLGCSNWKPLLQQLIDTGKPFKFKQGLDERILTDEKCQLLFAGSYDGDYTFAFDNVSDYDLIQKKLQLIRKYAPVTASIKFYVLVGFEGTDAEDIANAFKRIELLMRYGCLPYVMRYQDKNDTPWKYSEYKGIYIQLARWANQPSLFKKKSFRQFCELNQETHKSKNTLCAPMRALKDFEEKNPDIAQQYFDIRYEDYLSEWRNEYDN